MTIFGKILHGKRITRLEFLAAQIVEALMWALLIIGLQGVGRVADSGDTTRIVILWGVLGVGALTFLWFSCGSVICRARDLNMRALAAILLLFIPIVSLWHWFRLFFIRGTSGDNRFGPNPDEQEVAAT